MSPRTGRPKSDNAKSTQLAVRLTAEEVKKLDACVEHYQITRTAILRLGVEKLYEGIKKD